MADDKDKGDVLKSTRAETDALQTQTKAIKPNMAAMGDLGDRARRAAKDQETLTKALQAQTKAIGEQAKGMLSSKGLVKQLGSAIGGFVGKLKDAVSVGSTYSRLLEELQKGQKAYTSTLMATSNNIATASATSQKYINAVADAHRNARLIAAEYTVDHRKLKDAADELTKRFGTQIGAMGKHSATLQRLQKHSFVFGRYMGIEMSEAMDVVNERMQTSNKTIEEARKETILLTKVTDTYAKGLQSMGQRLLATATIGKKEFLGMIRGAGQAMKLGTFDSVSYGKALSSVLLQGEKAKLSAEEQRVAAKGLEGAMKEMFTFDAGGLSIFGTQAARKIRDQWDDLSFVQNEALRERLEIVRKQYAGAPEVQKLKALMDVLRGSAAGGALGLEMMKEGMSRGLSKEVLSKHTEGNLFVAGQIESAFNSGDVKKKLEETAAQQEKGAKGREEEAKVWEKSLNDLVKEGHTAKDLRYKAIQLSEQIKNKLFWIAEKFPLYFMAIAAAGAVGGLLKGAIGGIIKLLGGGGGGIASLLGGGIGGGLLGALGVGAAGAAGYGIGTGLDILGGRAMVKGDADLRRAAGTDVTASNVEAITALYDPKLIHSITRMREGEYQTLKKKVKLNKEIIKKLEARDKDLTYAERNKLDAIKKQTKAIKKNTEYEHRQRLEEESSQDALRHAKYEQRTRLGGALATAQVEGKSIQQIIDYVGHQAGAELWKSKGGTKMMQELTSAEYKESFGISKMRHEQAAGFREKMGPEKLQAFQAQFAHAIAEMRRSRGRGEELSQYIADVAKPGLTGSQRVANVPQQYLKHFAAAQQPSIKVSVESGEGGTEENTIDINTHGKIKVPIVRDHIVIAGIPMSEAFAEINDKQTKEQ